MFLILHHYIPTYLQSIIIITYINKICINNKLIKSLYIHYYSNFVIGMIILTFLLIYI